jgi:WD40 repeat protein/serine/threonine protein kinase
VPFPDRIGRYEYRGTIGVGGFASVARCYDEALDSLVAVKVLADTWAVDPEIRARFVQEAKLLRRIHNEHVVTVHDSGELDDGRPYFVMDYADRGTLEDRLGFTPPGHPIDAKTTRRVVLALTDGLAALHRAGIVHRDVKPGNLLLQSVNRVPATQAPATEVRTALIEAGERVLIGDLGLAKDLVATPSGATIIGGTQGFQPPEQRQANAAISPAADVYAATAVVWRLLRGSRPPDHPDVARSLTDVAAPWREIFEQGFAPDPDERFPSVESWRDALLSALDTDEHPSRSSRGASLRSGSGVLPCPYKGLAAFEPEDADYFFGREALVDQLVRRLRRDSVLVVGGPSGSGKSSLVRAGLVPVVADGALPGGEGWRVALFTPGPRPLGELHYQLARDSRDGVPTLDELRANPALARHTSATGEPLLLCIDQFEELFTLCDDRDEQAAFVDALAAHLDPADSRSRAVLVIRADFYGACAQFPWLTRRITENQVLVGPMDRSELRRAIEQPARRAGLSIDAGLTEAVLDEAGGEAGSLPLVAHALMETWTRRRHNTLTLDGFRAAGGVAGAIAKSADTIYDDELSDEQRRATRRLLLRLVTPGEDNPDTRRRMSLAELDRDERADLLRHVVGRLTAARLLTVDDTSVAIAHEALIRTWPRFRAWIEEDRENLLARQRISRAAAEWHDQGRDPDLLYRGTPLAVATEWAADNRLELNRLEQEFLDAAVEARDAAHHAAEQQAVRRRKVRRGVVGSLVLLTVAAVASAALAFASLRRTRASEQQANERFSASLAASGEALVDADPYLAMMLAAESGARTGAPTVDSRRLLARSRAVLAGAAIVPVGSPVDVGDAKAVAIDPAGRVAAVGERSGRIRLWDLASRRARGDLTGHTKGIERLTFSPDGALLASAGGDGLLRVWAVRGHDAIPRDGSTLGRFDRAWDVAFSPDGARLAVATEQGVIALYDVNTRRPLGPPLVTRSVDFLSVAFSPDGETVVAGDGRGELAGWSARTGEPRFGPLDVHRGNDVWELAFAPDGATVATSSSDGTSRLFDSRTGAAVADRLPFTGPGRETPQSVRGVKFGPDGRWMVAGAGDGKVRLWSTESNQVTATTQVGHRGAVIGSALSHDGSRLVTLGIDQTLRAWDIGKRTPLAQTLVDGSSPLRALAVSSDGSHAVTGDDAGSVRLWNLRTRTSTPIAEGRASVRSVALSRDGSRIAAGDADGVIRLTRRDGTAVGRPIVLEGEVSSVGFGPGDDWLVSGGLDGTVRFWTMDGRPDGEPLGPHPSGVARVAVSPDGELVAAAGVNGTVRVWESGSRRLRADIAADDNTIWGVAFSPDGSRLATASDDERVGIWDVATGRSRNALTGHAGGATDVRFSPDGRTLLTATKAGQLRLWDVETGQGLGDPLGGHTDDIWSVAWLPEAGQFLSVSLDGTFRRWDVLSVDRACALARRAFDAEATRHYLGAGGRLEACAR